MIAAVAMVSLTAACGGGGGGSGSDARVPVIDLTDPVRAITETDVAARADDRERAGLANLGPDLLALAAEMDAAAAEALDQFSADMAPASGLIRSTQGAPGPGFNSWSVYGTLVSSLDHLANNPTNATADFPPETTQVGGNTVSVSRNITANSTTSGSQLSVDMTIRMSARLTDASGNVLYTIESTASGHIDVNFCPDASGHTTAHVNLSSNETFTGGPGGGTTTRQQSADVGITVGDDANISAIEGTAEGSDSRQGVAPAGGSAPPVATRTSSDNIANDRNGRRLPGVDRNIQLGGENSTSDEQARLFGDTNIFMELMVGEAAKKAEKMWQSGKCVELIIDPEGRNVQPDEVVQVTAKLRHKIEGNELNKPVEATLTGVKTLEPAGEKQPAPATVTFTAGPDEGDFGRINFKSVSNRGIAEKSVTFTVSPAAWDVTFEGTDTEESFGSFINTFAATANLHITAIDGVLSGTGELHLTGAATVQAGLIVCNGPIDQVSPVVVSGTLEGEGQEAVLLVTLRPTSPPGQQAPMTCTGIGGTVTVDLPVGGYAERFGEPLLNFALPAAGGTVNVSETSSVGGVVKVTVAGTFTVTQPK